MAGKRETAHTTEPWEQDTYGDIRDANGSPVNMYARENRPRIVACINACAGIETEKLEGMHVDDAIHDIAVDSLIETKRADAAEALLEDGIGALQNILNGLSVDPNHDQDETWGNARRKARKFLNAARAFLGKDTGE